MKISKYAFVLLINIACSLQFCYGQVTFQKTYGVNSVTISKDNFGVDLQKTNDGDYLILAGLKSVPPFGANKF